MIISPFHSGHFSPGGTAGKYHVVIGEVVLNQPQNINSLDGHLGFASILNFRNVYR